MTNLIILNTSFSDEFFSNSTLVKFVLVPIIFIGAVIYGHILLKKTGINEKDFIVLILRSFFKIFNEPSPYYRPDEFAELIVFKKDKWFNPNLDGYFILQNDILLKLPDEETRIAYGFIKDKAITMSPNYFTKWDIYNILSVKFATAFAFRNSNNIDYFVEIGLNYVKVNNLYALCYLRNVNENFKENKLTVIENNKAHLYKAATSKIEFKPVIDIDVSQVSIDLFKERFNKSQETWLKNKYNKHSVNVNGKIKENIDILLFDIEYRKQIISNFEKLRTLSFKIKNIGYLVISRNSGWPEFEQIINTLTPILIKFENEIINAVDGFTKNNVIPADWEYFAQTLTVNLEALKDLPVEENYILYREFISYKEAVSELLSYPLNAIAKFTRPYNLLFSGRPYIGKSHGIAHYCKERLEKDIPSILIPALTTNEPVNWGYILQMHLDDLKSLNEIELFKFLNSWCDKLDLERPIYFENSEIVNIQTQLLICIDGLDEAIKKSEWIDRLNNLESYIETFPRLRFVFTSRPSFISTYLTAIPDSLEVIYLPDKSDAPFEELKKALFKEYNIIIQTENIIDYYIDNPLSLKLFCEQNKDRMINNNSGVGFSLYELIEKKIENLEVEIFQKLKGLISLESKIVRKFLTAIKDEFLINSNVNEERLFEIISNDHNTKNYIDRGLVIKLLELLTANETLSKTSSAGLTNTPTTFSIVERSVLEYLIVEKTFSDFNPNESPEVLRELRGALEMIAVRLFVEHGLIIGENNCWMNLLNGEEAKDLKLKVFSKVAPDRIRDGDVEYVKSEILK
ncbi:MAG: hypothetical protein ACK5QC_03150 [Bacteroidota bacterium]